MSLPPPPPDKLGATLEEQFVVAPFTVMDSRKWASRKPRGKTALVCAEVSVGKSVLR